jgi:hypothetical protein
MCTGRASTGPRCSRAPGAAGGPADVRLPAAAVLARRTPHPSPRGGPPPPSAAGPGVRRAGHRPDGVLRSALPRDPPVARRPCDRRGRPRPRDGVRGDGRASGRRGRGRHARRTRDPDPARAARGRECTRPGRGGRGGRLRPTPGRRPRPARRVRHGRTRTGLDPACHGADRANAHRGAGAGDGSGGVAAAGRCGSRPRRRVRQPRGRRPRLRAGLPGRTGGMAAR